MATHPRVVHLLSVPFLAELLAPSYASANRREAHEVYDEVKEGLADARLQGPLCDAVWVALKRSHPELADDELVDRLAKALAKKGGVKARAASKALEERMNALFATIDVHIERASEAVGAALETPAGREARAKAIEAAASHLIALCKV